MRLVKGIHYVRMYLSYRSLAYYVNMTFILYFRPYFFFILNYLIICHRYFIKRFILEPHILMFVVIFSAGYNCQRTNVSNMVLFAVGIVVCIAVPGIVIVSFWIPIYL